MRLLIDTQILVWTGQGSKRLPKQAAILLSDPRNRVAFSTVSVAEVAIKRARNRPDFLIDPRTFRADLLANEFEELPLLGIHACRVADLPRVHKDPFDRLLVAQALAEGIPLVTADKTLGSYPGQIIVV